MEKDLYNFHHYRDYLLHQVGPTSQRRGIKTRLASSIKCQPSMLSQVLSGRLDLSLEQGADVNRFFGHCPNQSHYFLLLLQTARAGTQDLRKYFITQIENIQRERFVLSKRLEKSNELSQQDRSVYYSSWHYSAVHIATTIPALQTRKALAAFFALPEAKLRLVIQFLEQAGLLTLEKGRLVPTSREIFLGSNSELIFKHHTNWRMQAIESLDRESTTDLHYSAVLSVSKADAVRIKEQCMQLIQNLVKTAQSSKEEALYSVGMDFFNLSRES